MTQHGALQAMWKMCEVQWQYNELTSSPSWNSYMSSTAAWERKRRQPPLKLVQKPSSL